MFGSFGIRHHVPAIGLCIRTGLVGQLTSSSMIRFVSVAEHGQVIVALSGGANDEAAIDALFRDDAMQEPDGMTLVAAADGVTPAKIQPDACFFKSPTALQRQRHVVTDAVRTGLRPFVLHSCQVLALDASSLPQRARHRLRAASPEERESCSF